MNDDQTLEQLVTAIAGECERLVDEFERVRASLLEQNPGWSSVELANNLMEAGRVQTSGVEEPPAADRELVPRYVEALSIPGETAFLFCAYASGCVVGRVAAGELSRDRLIDALHVIQHSSIRIFPENVN